uniref:Uncharacterized protein n=1 Tax=Anguilla anguilla TaxID=7936 RepID=A0A0E9UMY3_ANGAN
MHCARCRLKPTALNGEGNARQSLETETHYRGIVCGMDCAQWRLKCTALHGSSEMHCAQFTLKCTTLNGE